jgi:RNA polymerase sigma factor (sigma-70 family)
LADRHRRIRAKSRASLRYWPRPASDDRLVALVRQGDAPAFETLYDRHSRELLSFCRYILGSQSDAEDAVQTTFASAYRALLADKRRIDLRPWLFAIARNSCLSIIRQRRPICGVDERWADNRDPVALLEQREDLDQLLSTLLELPERQRAALVLAELHGLTQSEIGSLLGVRADQVKSYIYQARSSLISERAARGTDCREIREELATARGSSLLRNHLRRHVRSCPGCRAYADALSRQRRHFGILIPVASSLTFKHRTLQATFGKAPGIGTGGVSTGASLTSGTAAKIVGGGIKTFTTKLLAGIACAGGTGTSVGTVLVGGTLLLGVAVTHPGRAARTSSPAAPSTHIRSAAFVGKETSAGLPAANPMPGGRPQPGPGDVGDDRTSRTIALDPQRLPSAQGHGNSGVAHGNGDANGRSAASSGNSGAAHANKGAVHGNSSAGHGRSTASHGNSGMAHGNSSVAHGNSAAAHSNSGGASHRSANSRSNSFLAHGKSGAAHGPSTANHGNSATAHGNSGVGHDSSASSHGNSPATARDAVDESGSQSATGAPANGTPQPERVPPEIAAASKGGPGGGSAQGHRTPTPPTAHEGGRAVKHD